MTRHLTLLFLVLLGVTLFPQISQAQRFLGSGHFMLGFPQGEFKENVDNIGFGGGFFVGLGIGQAPVVLGLEGNFMIYGRETRREPLSTTIPDVTVDVTTTNNFFAGHAVLRLQAPGGNLRPYVDGLIGFNYLATETTVDDEGRFDDDPVFSSTNFDDAGFSFGAGGGLMVKLVDTETDNGTPFDVLLDLRIRYLIGSEVEYLREGSIRRENGQVDFDTLLSKTDTFLFQVGVAVVF